MKKLLSIYSLVLMVVIISPVLVGAQGPQTTINISTGDKPVPALAYKPDDYDATTIKYPLLMFFHGRGESGTNLAKIYNSSTAGGPAYYIAQGTWPASFTDPRTGASFKFIVLSPQKPGVDAGFLAPEIDAMISDAVEKYRVDTTRIYLMGISGGGGGLLEYLGRYAYSRIHVPAAALPMSAQSDPSQAMINAAVADSIRSYGFGDDVGGDPMGTWTRIWSTGNFSGNGGSKTVPAGYGNIFQGCACGHGGWNIFTNPATKRPIAKFYGGGTVSMSPYEWLLQFRQKGNVGSGNSAPTVSAGANQTITLPTSFINITATGTDIDGTIASYAWSQISGTTAEIGSPATANTNLTGMYTAGMRVFRVTVTDNAGATGFADVTVTVNAAGNVAPVASAGPGQAITLPTSTVTLSGSGTDSDGSIASYLWAQTSGTAATITSPTSANTAITGLTTAGPRNFRLTVTDNQGATSIDYVTITVNAATTGEKFVNVNMYSTNAYVDAAWNNWNTTSSLTSSTFSYSDGTASSITATLSAQSGVSDNGDSYPVTIYPQRTGRDVSYHNATRTLTISGLNNGKLYDLSFLGSRGNAGQSTTYTINGAGVTINTYLNYSSLASFSNISPTSGQIVVTMTLAQYWTYLNAFKITEKSTGGNSAPSVNGGGNKTISLPTTSVSLVGTATDVDGSIASYAWTQISGSAATIASPSTPTTNITGLTTAGVRVFRLTATDNSGATGSTDVIVTVNSGTNMPPSLSPRTSLDVVLPRNYQTVSARATDPDGSIVSYSWSQVSGTSATIVSATSAVTMIKNLSTPGVRVFRVTVTDNGGATAAADITITVAASVGTRKVVKFGIAEYYNIELLDNGTVLGTFNGADIGANKDTTAYHQITNVVDVAGSQYKCLALKQDGTVWVLGKITSAGSTEETYQVETDYLGNPFNKNAKIFGAFNSYMTIDSLGVPWMWGTHDFLGLAGAPTGTYFAPRPLQVPAGKKIVKVVPMEPVFSADTAYLIHALADDGTVYKYRRNGGGVPLLQAGLPTITDIAAISQFVYFAFNQTDAYAWGRYSQMVGLPENTQTPTKVTSAWTAAGAQWPLKEVRSNWTSIHVLDNKNEYFASGDNIHGNLANGKQWPNWSTKTPAAFSWNFSPFDYPQPTPVHIKGKYLHIWSEGIFSNFIFATDMGGVQHYSAGRNKRGSLLNGITHSNDNIVPECCNVPFFKKIDPLTVVWPNSLYGPVFDTNAVQKPMAQAGIDQFISTSSTILDGMGHQQGTKSIPEGYMTSYAWSKVSGPGGTTIVDPSYQTTIVNGLTTGKHVFRLIVTSNVGAQKDTAEVNVFANVASVPDNKNPVMNAGSDQSITLPTSSVTLSGSGTDADGIFTDVVWIKVTGPTATITNPASYSTTVTGLSAGTYVFELRGTDDDGAVGTDQVTITVIGINTPPVVTAGADQTITLPTMAVSVIASATDPGGFVSSYSWTKVSGPSAYVISDSTQPYTLFYNLVQGTYVFRLTAKDNQGSSGSDDIQITVLPQAINPPTEIQTKGSLIIKLLN